MDAWHRLVERHSAVIHSVLRRYLQDEEEVRDAYVDTLERLYKGQLARYEGRSSLSTWLVFVARSAALDRLRSRLGRRELPAGVKDLSEREREIFRRYYFEGQSFEAVRHWAALPADELAEILGRIEATLSRRSLRRYAYDLHASSVGAASGRLLEFLDHLREEHAGRLSEREPDYALLEKEARATTRRVRALIERLPEAERRILTLRFDHGLSARQIAESMGLEGQRQAYTQVDRALRRLRKWLGVNVFWLLLGGWI